MPFIGSHVKPFCVDAFCNGAFLKVADTDFLGQWSVLFFYPADFTAVCPTELEELADHYDIFKTLGVEIYSVSTDKHFTHKAWHEHVPAISKIRYVMIGDPAGILAKDFDVLPENNGHFAQRATFLIDPEGRIQYIEVTSRGVARSVLPLIEKIKAAQYVATHPGESCPAKWKPASEEAAVELSLNLNGKI